MKKIKIISVYIIAGIIIAASYIMTNNMDNDVVYAMVDNVYIYARTIGSNISADAENVREAVGDTEDDSVCDYSMIHMEEQNEEAGALQAINIQQPDLIINGLKTVFRDSIKLSKKDKNILYRIVEAEAGGEDTAGKLLVANVVLNRMNSGHYPNSVKGVVFANSGGTYQFSPVRDGRYYSVKVSDDTKKAVNRALDGEDNSQGAEYFLCRKLADKDNTKWFDEKLEYLFTHGCHEFFHR